MQNRSKILRIEKRAVLERQYELRRTTLGDLNDARTKAILQTLKSLQKENAEAQHRNQSLLKDLQDLRLQRRVLPSSQRLLQVAKVQHTALKQLRFELVHI